MPTDPTGQFQVGDRVVGQTQTMLVELRPTRPAKLLVP